MDWKGTDYGVDLWNGQASFHGPAACKRGVQRVGGLASSGDSESLEAFCSRQAAITTEVCPYCGNHRAAFALASAVP